MATTQERKRSRERWLQAAWSAAIALALSFFYIIAPLDELVWLAQARMAGFDASGDIVFVGTEQDLADPEFPQRREELARAIEALHRAGAAGVYLDMAFERPSRPASDRALNRALREFGPDAYLIRNMTSSFGSNGLELEAEAQSVAEGVSEVGGQRLFHLLGIVWKMPYQVPAQGRPLASAAARMAGVAGPAGEQFPIDYGFRADTIPTARLASLSETSDVALAKRFAGKQVVIGRVGAEPTFVIPGNLGVPGGMLHIYAAETLKAGHTRVLPELPLLLAGCVLLLLAARSTVPRLRHALYALIAASGPVCVLVTMQLGVRPNVSGLAALLVIFLAFRLRSRWKKEVLLVDQETGLPTFAALETDRQVARAHPTIIVAKMHRFEEVRQTLPAELHAEYVLRIIDRLNAAEPDTRIYLGPGHTIAWCVAEEDTGLVKDHLEGLRALFASPLRVGEQQVDVGMTFGVDISPSRDVARRLANATAAAERTSETYQPILIAETKSEEELIWNISLQARIDAALASGEIFLVYQPKIRIDDGEMIGVEALVRWRDPVRGLIPPDSFISQCEETGRMGHLTRHVLREACKAGVATGRDGATFSIAVNISATLLHDPAIVAMVREVLVETGFDPARLTLEITETSRISDMALAEMSLRDLTRLGITISMDDFGVGAASLEALLRLPFDELKIDRLFIDGLCANPRSQGIVASVLELGRQLGIKVVAEGVEDEATLALLRREGCPLAQGFGICRPVPLDEAVRFRDTSRKGKAQLSI